MDNLDHVGDNIGQLLPGQKPAICNQWALIKFKTDST
jgi:hypothetical protein